MTAKTFLHVGCGPKRKPQTTAGFNTPLWSEVRFDIDVAVAPDVIGSITDMGAVATSSMDAVFSSHNIEHLYPHEVPRALAEFRRVLAPGGLAVITCPDLRAIAALVVEDRLMEPAYVSPAGPISAIDMLYGHRASMQGGNLFMAHRGGFTLRSLLDGLRQAGFANAAGLARPKVFDLWVVATRDATSEDDLRALLAAHVPQARPGA